MPNDADAHSAEVLAADIALRLGEVSGVAAVVLGGSHARGGARADSDIDLGIYYHPLQPLDIPALQTLADELDDRSGSVQSDRGPEAVVTQPGAWGPWVNGGAWLKVQGTYVDWLYRDIEQVSNVIADCRAGRITADYYLGHPHAFHNYMYLAEVAVCQPLYDPGNVVAALKSLVAPYPPKLREEIIRFFLFDARFTLAHAEKPADRGDIFVVTGDLFRAVACMVQVLFALNGAYYLNEKGAVAAIQSFAHRPKRFSAVAERVLAAPGKTPEALHRSVAALHAQLTEIETLVERTPR